MHTKASHLLEWLLPERQEITSVGVEVEKRNPHTSLVGVRIGTGPVESSMESLENIKNRTTVGSSCSASGYLSKDRKTLI